MSEADRESLQNDERFGAYEKITQAAQYFRAPEFKTSSSYDRLREKQLANRPNSFKFWKLASGIAAILILGLLAINLLENQATTHTADYAEKVELTLPDTSQISLNAGSQISYDQNNWDQKRLIALEGEALFKVAKGSTFTVETAFGNVKVLGTEFNVVNREGLFEVTCFEGRVLVTIDGTDPKELLAGEGIKYLNKRLTRFQTGSVRPNWVKNKSVFKSTPLHIILGEIERQYDITIDAAAIDKNVIFTGSFTHQDLDTALKAVTLPLDLQYEVVGSKVKLKK